MTKLKTQEPLERGLRVLSGSLRVTSRANEWLYNVELDLLDDRRTANGWRYENLEKHRAGFAGIPILIAYTNAGKRIGDGHNYRMKRTKDGREYASFTDATSERIIGTLSDNEADIRLEVRDGHKWIVGKGTIWAWYAAEAVEKIASQGRMDVSIETLVSENRMEGEEEVETAYTILGVTILGDGVTPAVAGAGIRPLSAIDLRELKMRAASYIQPEEKTEDKPAAKTAEGVRHMNNAKRMREVEKMFPGERVLCMSDDGLTVGLLNLQSGDVRAHCFTAEEPSVVIETRFSEVNAKVNMVLENGTELNADISKLVGDLQSRVNEMSKELEEKDEALNKAEKTIENMEKAETERRRSEAKAAVHKALEEINRVQEAKDEATVDEKVCEDVDEDIDEGEYDDCKNAKGEWCGAEKACAAVKAKCMDYIRKENEAALARKRKVNTWDEMGLGGNANGDNVFDLLK